MCKEYARQVFLMILLLMLGLITIAPAYATTLSFETTARGERDGKLTGQLVFEKTALDKAIQQSTDDRGQSQPIPISDIEGAKFSYEYQSPYSGVKHTQETLCDRGIYDLNGYETQPIEGGKDPRLVLSLGSNPNYIDFSSCIGTTGDSSSKISRRDPRLVYSSFDSWSGKMTVVEKDVSDTVLFKKILPIEFTLKEL
jgi:hypothetical protein